MKTHSCLCADAELILYNGYQTGAIRSDEVGNAMIMLRYARLPVCVCDYMCVCADRGSVKFEHF